MSASGGISDFLDLMPLTVTVEEFASNDTFGARTYAVPASFRARVVYKNHYVRGPSGELVAASGMIWVATAAIFTDKARVTLPDGQQPQILMVAGVTDETGGILYVRVDFG